MCGINGIYGIERLDNPKGVIQRMNDKMAHRGPDADGVYQGENVVLGHRRLSIIDLSAAANQPFYSHDQRYVIVYNGELYNYQEVKTELSDYPFKTSTDTEVVIAAYAKWGMDCLSKFNGMFAFALWDTMSNELVLVRDRMGIKPLYYYWGDDHIVFSSEIRSVLASKLVPAKMDDSAVVDYLRYQTVHAPHTLVKDVKMLLPGHYMVISDNEQIIHKYWDVTTEYDREARSHDYDTVKKNVKDLLLDSVQKRLVADVPFGAFLSGGIDSSVIVGLMSEIAEKKVKTFSVTFDEEEFSEAKYARMIAEKFGTDHTEIRLKPNDFLDVIPNALNAMDHPSGDGPNTYIVSKVTKESGITMALSGLGGDELFAGYDIFKRTLKLNSKKWALSFPMMVRKMAGGTLKTFKPSVASDKMNALLRMEYWDVEHAYQVARQVMLDANVAQLLNRDKLPVNNVFQLVSGGVASGQPGAGLPMLSKVSYAEINTYMQNVLLRDTDQMSMAHALEVRVPFLDHRLTEYVFGVSDQHKFPHTPKKLLTDAMGDLLPSEVVNRPKMGFTLPWQHWLKNELHEFAETSMHNLAERNFFDATQVKTMWARFMENDPRITWSRVWYLIVLENWLAQHEIES
jgi:asparagine synthase (glutamine-hydrolysing)